MDSLQSVLGSSYIVSEDKPTEIMKRIIHDKSREDASFYVLNLEEVIRRFKVWKVKLPRVKPHYAVKCNDHPAVVKTLALLGAGFDCASRPEIKAVLSCGVKPSRIIYAHPCKVKSHLSFARSKGVKKMTFDSEQELYKIAELYPDAEILIRIRCDAAEVQCNLGIKFGVMPDEARPLLTLAGRLNLNVVGVAFHVGSGCSEPSVFERAIYETRRVFDEAIDEGHSPRIVDIGGGFLSGSLIHLEEASQYINSALSQYFPEEGNVEIIAEPGRYMVASAFTLCTPIINFKANVTPTSELPHEFVAENCPYKDEVKTKMYYIDDGVYGSFNCILYDHQVVKPVPIIKKGSKKGGRSKSVSSIWGPTCDGFDQVMKAVILPDLSVGDYLMWENMGAYTLSAAGQFNGFSVPKVKVCINSATKNMLETKLLSYALNNKTEDGSMVRKKKRSSAKPDLNPINGIPYTEYITAAMGNLSCGPHHQGTSSHSSSGRSSLYSSDENVEN